MGRERKATSYETRYVLGHFCVEDVLSKQALDDLMQLARSRIIGVFREATEEILRPAVTFEHQHNKAVGLQRAHWKTVRTDNYIGGVSSRQKDLAWHIQTKIKNRFLRSDNLQSYGRTARRGQNVLAWTSEIKPALVDKFIAEIERQIILAQLNVMCGQSEIWYNEMDRGIWQMQQSVIDEFQAEKSRRRQEFKRDDRNYHGRNRAQSTSRGVAAGTSIGGQYATG